MVRHGRRQRTTNLGLFSSRILQRGHPGLRLFPEPGLKENAAIASCLCEGRSTRDPRVEHRTSRYLAQLPSADLVLDPGKMYVQGGVSYRGTITMDLSALPRPVSVSECILELTLDSASSRRTGGPDSLYAFFIQANDRVEKLSAVVSERTTLNEILSMHSRSPCMRNNG